MLLWIPELALFGSEMFTSQTPRLDANASLSMALLGFMAIEMVISIWQFVVYLKCVGEVHEFSAWKALGASLLAFLVMIGAVFGIVIVVSVVIGGLG